MALSKKRKPDAYYIDVDGKRIPLFYALDLVAYADNAAAITGGLAVGDLYRLGDTVGVVH